MTAKLIQPDESNLIDLPGVGSCPRPVDIDQTTTGFDRLTSLRAYRFAAGLTVEGESEVEEVLILLVSGMVRLEITGTHKLTAELAAGQILYMPPDHAYRLTPSVDAVVAYGRARAAGRLPARMTAGSDAKGETLALAQLRLNAGEEADIEGEALVLVISGAVESSGAVAGPLSVLAVSAESLVLRATECSALWIFSA